MPSCLNFPSCLCLKQVPVWWGLITQWPSYNKPTTTIPFHSYQPGDKYHIRPPQQVLTISYLWMFDLYLYPLISIVKWCCNIKSTDAMIKRLCECVLYTTYNIIISHAFPVLILSLPSGLTLCWQYLQGCISSCSCRAQCSGEPTWSLTPGGRGAVTAWRTPWRKFWRENAESRQSFSWSSVAWGCWRRWLWWWLMLARRLDGPYSDLVLMSSLCYSI